jgi:putative transposase
VGFSPGMAKPSRPSDPQHSKGQLRTFFTSTKTYGGLPLLQTERMATLLIDVLQTYTFAGKFKVHDFVVMRDHLHLLFTVDDEMTVEKVMQLVKGGFSFRAKKELENTREIWQRGFSDVRIRDESSFRAHQEYIWDNPVKAGLAKSAEEYPYSSDYFKKPTPQGLKPTLKKHITARLKSCPDTCGAP